MKMVDKMASDLCLDQDYIASVVKRSRFYYRDYYIDKRDGGKRKISQPSSELKTLQYWVKKNILSKLPVSDSAYAYQKGASIKKHAQVHQNSRHIFHTDICSFFPSISYEHLHPILLENSKLFEDLNIDFDSIDTIRDICYRENQLCVGAVSSPIISNIIMYRFDVMVLNYCRKNDLKYSRYADDIYLSANSYIDAPHIDFLSTTLRDFGFQINEKKTYFSSTKYRRKVTGLIIGTDSSVTVGSEKRKLIKKLVYDKLVHNEGDGDSILGYLAFLKDIEPHTYNNIIAKYSQYCEGDIIDALSK